MRAYYSVKFLDKNDREDHREFDKKDQINSFIERTKGDWKRYTLYEAHTTSNPRVYDLKENHTCFLPN